MMRTAARVLMRPRVGAAVAVTGLGASTVFMDNSVKPPSPFQAHSVVRCHCQVPCGIFHDDGRIASILEDAQTIRKAVVQCQELHKSGKLQDVHQMVRWINTKEDHAAKIMNTVSEYFMAQKIKKELLSDHDYYEVLGLHHAVLVAAMKAKQSSELAAVDALDKAIQALRPVYEKK
eukprot:TRINITY_DN96008_c0_g1_i1.p1 TRINITY_DN96008_c0_g1~~TRINITY_DN96008_c0_g1_i1.p1  ORF type:complete len:176 (-),score=49.13 TRINITY_DN96008_c0_g1_i1:216-743(-)